MRALARPLPSRPREGSDRPALTDLHRLRGSSRPASVGVRGAACEMDTPAAEFEEEEHREASEPQRVDREEVAGDDRVGVGTQEGAPTELGTSTGRGNAGLPQDLGDRRCRDADTDAGELTDDPPGAPARVLTRESQHEFTNLLRDCGPARPRPAYVHRLRTSWRCQPSRVFGRTKNERVPRPRSWPAAARKTRSGSSNRGREIWRRSTASSWPSTTISGSLNSRERTRSDATASARRNSRYSNDTTNEQPPFTPVREGRL